MQDQIIIPKGSAPAYRIEGGEFEITLTSKTGKKKIQKGHNEVSEQFQKLAPTPLYYGAFPWNGTANSYQNGWVSPQDRNDAYMTIGLEKFYYNLFGVEALGETASGQDRYFKGTKLTGMATSSTQHANADRGIIQESSTTQLGRYRTQFKARWLFGQGKGDGIYDILYIPMISNISGVGSADSIFGDYSVNGACIGLQSSTYNDGLVYTPHSCWGMGKRLAFTSFTDTLSNTRVFNFDDYNELSVNPAYASLYGWYRYSWPVRNNYWHANTKPSEFGFSAITNPRPINIQTKAYTSTNPYNIQFFSAVTNTVAYYNIPEFGTQPPRLVGAQRVSQNRYVYKYRNENQINGVYYYVNLMVDIVDGLIDNISSVLVETSSTAYPALTDVTLSTSDYVVSRGYGSVYNDIAGNRYITHQEFLDYPRNGGGIAILEAHPVGISIGSWRAMQIVSEMAAMGGSSMNRFDNLRYLDDIPFNDIHRMGCYVYGSAPPANCICSRHSAPFFSCYNTGGITKDTTDTLSVLYTLNIVGVDPLQQIINPNNNLLESE